jgi:VanZ family protein
MFFKHTKWALLWALFILILCGIPGSDIPSISVLEILNFDKFVHASIFFILIILTYRGFLKQNKIIILQNNSKIFSISICIAYGGLTEILQGIVFVERSADLFDFIANSFGCILGVIFYSIIENKILRKINL